MLLVIARTMKLIRLILTFPIVISSASASSKSVIWTSKKRLLCVQARVNAMPHRNAIYGIASAMSISLVRKQFSNTFQTFAIMKL